MQQLAFQSQHKIEFVEFQILLFQRKDKLSRSSEMQWQWNGLLVRSKLAKCDQQELLTSKQLVFCWHFYVTSIFVTFAYAGYEPELLSIKVI